MPNQSKQPVHVVLQVKTLQFVFSIYNNRIRKIEQENYKEINELQSLISSQFQVNKKLKLEVQKIIHRLEDKVKQTANVKRTLENRLSQATGIIQDYQNLCEDMCCEVNNVEATILPEDLYRNK